MAGDFNIATYTQALRELVGWRAPGAPSTRPARRGGGPATRRSASCTPRTRPAPAGLDDRFDQILLSSDLLDRAGWDYRGDASLPYDTWGWDDAAHSYRAWGNSGSSFNASLTLGGNEMVGESIAASLVRAAYGAGHLPVYLDLHVVAEPPGGRNGKARAGLRRFARARARPDEGTGPGRHHAASFEGAPGAPLLGLRAVRRVSLPRRPAVRAASRGGGANVCPPLCFHR